MQKIQLSRVGFEPTPPERLRPKRSALDHSAILTPIEHVGERADGILIREPKPCVEINSEPVHLTSLLSIDIRIHVNKLAIVVLYY